MRLSDLLHSHTLCMEEGRGNALWARMHVVEPDFVAPPMPELRLDSGERERIAGSYMGLSWYSVGSGMVVRVDGDLVPSAHHAYDGQCVGYEELRTVLEQIGSSDMFDWTLLAVHCPGGTASGTSTFNAWMMANAERYNIHGFVNEMAASGGYYIIASTRSIGASKHGRTASIGAYSKHLYLLEPGIGVQEFKSADQKMYGYGHMYRPLDEDEKKHRQASIEESGRVFAEAVADGRRLALDVVQGTKAATLSSEEALDIGLVDRLCTLDQMINHLEIQAMDQKLLELLKAQNEAEATTKIETLLSASARLEAFETTAKGIAGESDPSVLLARFSSLQQNVKALEETRANQANTIVALNDQLKKTNDELRTTNVALIKARFNDRLNPDRTKALDQFATSGASLEVLSTYAESLSIIAPTQQFQTPQPPQAPAGNAEGSQATSVKDIPKEALAQYRASGMKDEEIVEAWNTRFESKSKR